MLVDISHIHIANVDLSELIRIGIILLESIRCSSKCSHSDAQVDSLSKSSLNGVLNKIPF